MSFNGFTLLRILFFSRSHKQIRTFRDCVNNLKDFTVNRDEKKRQ